MKIFSLFLYIYITHYILLVIWVHLFIVRCSEREGARVDMGEVVDGDEHVELLPAAAAKTATTCGTHRHRGGEQRSCGLASDEVFARRKFDEVGHALLR